MEMAWSDGVMEMAWSDGVMEMEMAYC